MSISYLKMVVTWICVFALENGTDLKLCINYLKMVKCSDLKCVLVIENGRASKMCICYLKMVVTWKCVFVTWKW